MLRKIATIATITTATIAMVACSPEPTPEITVEHSGTARPRNGKGTARPRYAKG